VMNRLAASARNFAVGKSSRNYFEHALEGVWGR